MDGVPFSLLLQLILLLPSFLTVSMAEQQLINISMMEMFVDELPDMPRIKGYRARPGITISRTLRIGMFKRKWKFHRDLPHTVVFAYGTSRTKATVPGPTIEALRMVETRVVWENYLPPNHILPWDASIPTATARSGVPTVTHLHGGVTPPASDGHVNAWFTAQWKEKGPTWKQRTYTYPNQQPPGNAWYHDHAMGLTRVNLLAGLIGFYAIRDPPAESRLRLPEGDEFDRPIVIFDRSFRSDGSIYMNSTGDNPSVHPQWQPEFFGEAILVNGKAWPKLTVRRRKYRFRILNASNARFYRLFLDCAGVNFIHVGSDSVYLPRSIITAKFLLAPSEIADVLIDFSTSPCDEVILSNDAPCPFPSGNPTNDFTRNIMKFIIKSHPATSTDIAAAGTAADVSVTLLRYPMPKTSDAAAARFVFMYEYSSDGRGPTHLYLNGKSFEEPATETPREGTTELWTVVNLTDDNHPLHIHLGLFVVQEQRELLDVDVFTACMITFNDPILCNLTHHSHGVRISVPPYERGWKNVYKMRPGCSTKILVRFSPLEHAVSYPFNASAEPGYVYHCHILDHEDNVMMRPLKIIP